MIIRGTDRVAEFVGMFDIDTGQTVANEKILHEAKRLLQKIAMDSQLQLLGRKIEPVDSIQHSDHEIYLDSLTRVHNRRFLDEMLQEKINDQRSTTTSLGILFLDVDDFKSINDSFGHTAGDKAISHVADALVASVRDEDFVLRLGGDEFLVVLLDPSELAFKAVQSVFRKASRRLSSRARCIRSRSRSAECTTIQQKCSRCLTYGK